MINHTKILTEISLRARWVLVGIALVVALNSFDKVLTVNIWPSVLTAHGVM